jgi:hypothetical protein
MVTLALFSIPILSHAEYTNCGSGRINSLVVRQDGNVAIDLDFSTGHAPVQTWELTIIYTNVAPTEAAALRSTLLSAYHSGSHTQFYGERGCFKIVAVGLCKDEASCKVGKFMNFVWW